MNRLISRIVFVVLTAAIIATSTSAQQFKANRFQLAPSALIGDIKALKAANPKMPAAELAKAADAILEKSGVQFAFSFDADSCDAIAKVRDTRKDPTAPLKLGTTLKSVEADVAGLELPEPRFSSPECGGCGVDLPVLQITDADFITIVGGRNIRFVLPSNFTSNVAVLLDPKDQTTVKRKWRIPFRAVPIGVSFDESVLYLGFSEPELSDLALTVFSEGVFQIGTRSEADEGGKGKILPPTVLNGWQTVRLDRWKQTYLIRYRPPC